MEGLSMLDTITISGGYLSLIATQIWKSCGIYFDESNIYSLNIAIKERMSVCQIDNVELYYKRLRDDSYELEELISLIVVHETYFFRDKNQFDVLVHHVLPKIIEEKRNYSSEKPKIKIVSWGCSYGAEPYSIAIAILEAGLLEEAEIEIFALDINRETIEKAKRGCFSKYMFREPNTDFLKKYFMQSGGLYSLNSQIKKMVRFEVGNIFNLGILPISLDQTDIFFLRNVLIYFNKESSKKVLDSIYHHLTKSGSLFLGSSESLLFSDTLFELSRIGEVPIWIPIHDQIKKKKEVVDLPTSRNRDVLEGTFHKLLSFVEKSKDKPAEEKKVVFKPSVQEEIHYENALGYLQMKKIEQAEKSLKDQLKLIPDHVLSMIQLAAIYADTDRDALALDLCEKILEKDVLADEVYFIKGVVSFKKGEFDSAITNFKRNLYCDEANFVALYYLGLSYKQKNKLEESKKYFLNTEGIISRLNQDELKSKKHGYTADYIYSLCSDMVA